MRMARAIGGLLRTMATAFDPDAADPEVRATIPPLNRAWANDDIAREERRLLALAALEDSTVAVFGVVVDEENDEYEVRLLGDVPQECWPVVAMTLGQVAREANCLG